MATQPTFHPRSPTASDAHPPSTSSQNGPSPSSHTKSPTANTVSPSRRAVVTTPPWARHEPPLPSLDDNYLSPISPNTTSYGHRAINGDAASNDGMQSDIASMTSSGEDPPHSGNWWMFTLPRRKLASTPEAEPDSPIDQVAALEQQQQQRRQQLPHHHSLRFSIGAEKDPQSQRREAKSPKTSPKEKNRTSWLFGYTLPSYDKDKDKDKEQIQEHDEDDGEEHRTSDERQALNEKGDSQTAGAGPSGQNRPKPKTSNTLRLDVPLPPAPFTMAQAKTPGWDSPWAPQKHKLRAPGEAHLRGGGGADLRARPDTSVGRERSMGGLSSGSGDSSDPSTPEQTRGYWNQKRRKWRSFCLYNNYVPLLFRILNLSFTSATLGLAIQMRRTELRYGLMGVVGSSPTIAIIFAPPTILHVLIAIYLEYFGRPLGLWRTSAKLAHTLVEVLFICAWSASLSLCFDNYYTSSIQCTSERSTRWWSESPRPPNPLEGRPEDQQYLGHQLCDQQVALLCLVFIGLQFYCSNLVISLYRIIEKVKYHSSSMGGRV